MYVFTQTSTCVLNNKQVQIKLYYYYNDHEDSWLQVSTFFLSNMVMKTENDTLLDLVVLVQNIPHEIRLIIFATFGLFY